MKILPYCLLTLFLFLPSGVQAEVTINLSKCKKMTPAVFKAAAKNALSRRRWVQEKETSNSVSGVYKNRIKSKITMVSSTKIVISFVPGFEHKKDFYLWNLKKDFLDELTR